MSDGPTFARIDPQPANNSNNNNNNNSNNDAIDFDSWITANTAGDDGIAAAPAATAAGGNGNTTNFTDTQIEAWRERERRQRSIRSFMMFLLMLLLMDGDEQNQRRHQRQQHRNGGGGLRGAGNNHNNYNNNNNDDGYDLYGNRRHATDSLHRVESDMELYRARRTQDRSIEDIVLHGNHSRVRRLVSKNHGRDIDREIRLWAEEQKIIQTRAIYEQLLKDLIFEQPDGSYVKVLVASRSNNEAVMLVDDGPRVLLNAAAASVSVRNANVNANANANNNNNNNEHDTTEEEDALKDAMYKFDEFRDSELEVWHYPRNATGYYRGDWKIIDKASPDGNDEEPGPTVSSTASSKTKTKTKTETPNQAFASQNTSSVVTPLLLLPLEAEDILLEHLQNQADPSIGLHLLPPGMEMEMELESKLKSKASNHNRLGGAQLGNENQNENQNEDEVTTATSGRRTTKDAETTSYDAFALRGSSNFNANVNSGADALSSSPLPEKISLSKTSGKIAFQLYSKSVPTMKELSLIDGYVKLYNSNAVGYSTRRDILMRVHGVLVHSLGKLSLVANPRSRGRAALIVNGPIGTDSNSSSNSNGNSNSNTAKEKQRQKDEDNDNGNHNGKTEPTAGGKPLVSESHDGGDSDRDLDLDRRRRLQELLLLTTTNDDANQQASDDEMVEEIRSHALKLFSSNNNNDNNDHVVDLSSYTRIQTEADDPKNSDEDHFHKEYAAAQHVLEEQNASALGETSPAEEVQKQRRRRLEKGTATKQHSTMEDEVVAVTMAAAAAGASASAGAGAIDIEDGAKSRNLDDWSDKQANYIYSKHVIPFPFAWDDEEQSLQHFLPASARSMSGREQSLELNAGSCEFEFNMDIQEEKWTIGQWKKLISRQMENEMLIPTLGSKLKQGSAIPSLNDEDNIYDDGERKRRYKKSSKSPTNENSKARKRGRTEEAWVMMINGTVVSPNCDFAASINTNAIRTDWETTTGKAINYSFFMMTICLTQIVLLMRQLLHTQTQSASMRVSLLCIGWHTVVDALLCLVHIYLSLVMQPLFTTFASVAFFKLLIFCVIEMKYMAIIVQARNAHNGINSTELLRRQIAMLHLRFYVALLGACLGFFYSENCRTLYMLVLYSFWVPQIVHNVITEAKKPMNTHYVYGMSLTRMVAPLYMFAVQGNFLKAIYPESPTNVFMCQLLVAWIGMQACILHAQSRFGARFFIPAQFLPPKYDYNRPIPLSVLQSHDETGTLSEQLKKEREVPKTEVRPLSVQKTDLSLRGGVARNRKDGKRTKGESCMTAETVTEVPKNAPCIECVICYNDIDTSNRAAYMIAPCDHIFHKDCLVQWMEVKMECPICRRHLPTP